MCGDFAAFLPIIYLVVFVNCCRWYGNGDMDIIEKIRVVVVDDHAAMRQCLVSMVNGSDDMEVVATATNGALAVELAKEILPDIVLMDINMPVMDGIEASRRIIEFGAGVEIILVSASFSEYAVSGCVDLAIKGFVEKARAGSQLLNAIRSVMQGESYIGRGMEALKAVG